MAEAEGRREKDLDLVEEFESVRAVTSDGRSVRIPKSKIGGNLETATETVLGGIKAAEKTEKETVDAKIDPVTGKLFVPKGGSAPDDEDITLAEIGGEEKLQFKDKQYNASTYSGLGRKYLRKNMVNEVNVLTQDFFTNEDGTEKTNTRYIIQYDYDLNGATLTIPDGCVLVFQGGSLKNGSIYGKSTRIESTVEKIFDTTIKLLGSWDVPTSYAEWFGAIGDGENDDRPSIQKALDYFKSVRLLNKKYTLQSYSYESDDTSIYSVCLYVRDFSKLEGVKQRTSNAFLGSQIVVGSNIQKDCTSIISLGNHSSLGNISVGGNKDSMDFTSSNRICGITNSSKNGYRITMRDVDIKSCHYAVNMACWMSTLEHVCCKSNKYGIVLHAVLSGASDGVMDLDKSNTFEAEITSYVIQQCYCNDCFIVGYYLYGMVYSNIISCAADGCGVFVRENWTGYPESLEVMSDSNTYPPYYIERCTAINVSACGSEQCVKLYEVKDSSNVAIDKSLVYMLLQDDFLYTNWIKSTNNFDVEFKNIKFYTTPWRMDVKFINVDGGNTLFENIVEADYNVHIPRKFIYVSNSAKVELRSIDECEDVDLTFVKDPGSNTVIYEQYNCTKSLLSYLSILSEPKNIKYYTNTGYGVSCQPLTVNGRKCGLIFYGDSKDNEGSNIHLVSDSGSGCVLENFNSVTFTNCWLYKYNTTSIEYLFKFINCGIILFDNVKFSALNGGGSINWFVCEGNSDIVLRNCTLPDGSVVNYGTWNGKWINLINE